jgi:hypothetical protein
VGGVSRARGWGAFRSLAGNKTLLCVVGGYVLFTLTEYSVWGGDAGVRLPAWRRDDRRAGGAGPTGAGGGPGTHRGGRCGPALPGVLLAGGYLVQAAGMAATAAAVIAGVPLAAYAAAVVASTAVTTTRPAQSTLLPSVSVTRIS